MTHSIKLSCLFVFVLTLQAFGQTQNPQTRYPLTTKVPEVAYQVPQPATPPKKAVVEEEQIFKSIETISVSSGSKLTAKPDDQSASLFKVTKSDIERDWADTEFHWAASDFYHRPLYFEYIPLERYGQSTHRLVQPWLCGAHFFGTFPILPYKMGVEHPHDRVYAYGYYRPGSYAPRQRQHLPWERRGAFYEASFWVALAFAFP